MLERVLWPVDYTLCRSSLLIQAVCFSGLGEGLQPRTLETPMRDYRVYQGLNHKPFGPYLTKLKTVAPSSLKPWSEVLICQSVYILNFTYVLELSVVTKRMELWIQAAVISYLHRVAGLCLRNRVKSLDIQREHEEELLLYYVKITS